MACWEAEVVEQKLWSCCCCRAYSLTATDAHGRSFEFVIKSWANGTEHRRVYVLEQAAPFIKAHCLAAGDAVGVCTNGSGALTILANTPEVAAPPWCCSACRLLSSTVSWPTAADCSLTAGWRNVPQQRHHAVCIQHLC
jgi:hypothetical protein